MLEDQYNKHPNLAKKWINLGMIISHQAFSYANIKRIQLLNYLFSRFYFRPQISIIHKCSIFNLCKLNSSLLSQPSLFSIKKLVSPDHHVEVQQHRSTSELSTRLLIIPQPTPTHAHTQHHPHAKKKEEEGRRKEIKGMKGINVKKKKEKEVIFA